jgi:DNA-binding MarR family transcriptional regulator
MGKAVSPKSRREPRRLAYILEEQVGFILRQVSQRHSAIFAEQIGGGLTPTQWAVLVKLSENGPCSQNRLGRTTATGAATIKGVVGRMTLRGLTQISADPEDRRQLQVSLTKAGQQVARKVLPNAIAISEATFAPLGAKEREQLLVLLSKLL